MNKLAENQLRAWMTSPVKMNQIPYVYSYNSDKNTTSNSEKTHNIKLVY